MSIILFSELGSWPTQAAIQRERLSPNARELLRQLALCVDEKIFKRTKGKYTLCWPGRARLMEDTCLGHSSLDRARAELRASGFVREHSRSVEKQKDKLYYTINRAALGIYWEPGKWKDAPRRPQDVVLPERESEWVRVRSELASLFGTPFWDEYCQRENVARETVDQCLDRLRGNNALLETVRSAVDKLIVESQMVYLKPDSAEGTFGAFEMEGDELFEVAEIE